jgi:hypothetical protein
MADSARLADLCEAIVDCPHSTPVWTDVGVVVLRNQNIRNGRLDLGKPSYTDDRPQQKTMANSTQQARNIDGSLVVGVSQLPVGPVLLVDDMVDSRWTLTVGAWLLRSRGSGEVFPLALGFTGHGE